VRFTHPCQEDLGRSAARQKSESAFWMLPNELEYEDNNETVCGVYEREKAGNIHLFIFPIWRLSEAEMRLTIISSLIFRVYYYLMLVP
jgi:hypothetical protein